MSKKSRNNSSVKSSKAPTKTALRGKTSATKAPLAAGKKATKGAVTKAATKNVKPAAGTAPKVSPKIEEKTLKTASGKKSAAVKTKAATAGGVTEGAKAPTFRLPRDGGESVSLADYAGRKLVIFFYPRADTPGCTKEAIDFTRLSKDFAAARTAVLGVSADPLKAQAAFQKKHKLNMPLGSDETHAMLKAYGAWGEKSMYGKTFEGVLRTTVLIGDDGKISKIWHGVKVDGHADAVLEAARQI